MLSMKYDAIRSRIRRLPQWYEDAMRTSTKGDAYRLVEVFRQGIEGKEFPLVPLKKPTVLMKQRMGYGKPRYPLRGLGADGARTLVSSVRVYKLANGWVVKAPQVKHHASGLTVAQLLAVHERGMVVKNGRGYTRIPARPAFSMALKQVRRERGDNDPSPDVRRMAIEGAFGDSYAGAEMKRYVEDMERKYGKAAE